MTAVGLEPENWSRFLFEQRGDVEPGTKCLIRVPRDSSRKTKYRHLFYRSGTGSCKTESYTSEGDQTG